MSITVSLDINAKPPVTVSLPDPYPVSAGVAETLIWVPAATGQAFKFKSLTFDNNPSAFGPPNVTPAQVTVQDTPAPPGGPANTYPYTILVESGGKTYSSDPPGLGGVQKKPGIRNG